MALLEVNDLHVSYGAIHAIQGISFRVDEGEIVTMIGSNGAGKSTIMNTIAGLVRPSSGRISFGGRDMTSARSSDIVRAGISLSPEGRQIFPQLTVEENISLGAYTVDDKARVSRNIDRMYELFPRLRERRRQMGGTLSGGEQQMLAVARALMSESKLLMLDEPSLGLAPIIVQELFELFKAINASGTTLLLVEQNARMALQISDRGYVLETGRIVLEDTGSKLADDPKVREAYLGGL